MNKNKYTFAQELLRSYKLTPEQKERVLALITRERNEDIARLEERIKALETGTSIAETPSPIIEKETFPSDKITETEQGLKKHKSYREDMFYKPIDQLPKFLTTLNRGTFTKYLTHKIDTSDYEFLKEALGGSYTHQAHLKQIKKDFEKLTNEDFRNALNPNIYAKIKSYIYGGGEGWSEEHIQMNWSHPELLAWVQAYPNHPIAPDEDLHMEGFSFEQEGQIVPFSDLITTFKDQIHIRTQNSIKKLFQKLNRSYNFAITYTKIDEGIDFYTDVEKLLQMFRICFNWIRDSKEEKKQVFISASANKTDVYIVIVHLNTYEQSRDTLRYGKSSINLMKLANGLCDIQIMTYFTGDTFEYWSIWEKGMRLKGNKVCNTQGEELKPSDSLKKRFNLSDIKGTERQVVYVFKFSRGL